MFTSIKDMYKAANWSGKGFASRDKLMEQLQSNSIERLGQTNNKVSKESLPG